MQYSRFFTCLLTIFLVISMISPSFAKAPEASLVQESREANILGILENPVHTIRLADPESLHNKEYAYTLRDVQQELETEGNKICVQLFETINHTQVLSAVVDSIEEIQTLTFLPPPDLMNQYTEQASYKIPYSIVISTPNYTGTFDFDRYYLQDRASMEKESLLNIMEYNLLNNLDKPINMAFHKNEHPIKELKKDSTIKPDCIACIGYTWVRTDYETKWTNLAQVHSIKGVKTTFTLSRSKNAATSFQMKTAFKGGGVEGSGSTSLTISEKVTFPALQGSSINSLGKWAQAEVKYAKSIYRHPNGNEFTKISAYDFIGGSKWGSPVSGNGANFDNVSGSSYTAGTTTTIALSSSVTNSSSVALKVYASSVGLNNTTISTTDTDWLFEFLKGMGFKTYKVYNKGQRNNLTAK
ncbi:MAG: hypothetical protein ACI4XL_12675 [Bacillus sp. (in: firmicutes)]